MSLFRKTQKLLYSNALPIPFLESNVRELFLLKGLDSYSLGLKYICSSTMSDMFYAGIDFILSIPLAMGVKI